MNTRKTIGYVLGLAEKSQETVMVVHYFSYFLSLSPNYSLNAPPAHPQSTPY